MHRSLVPENIVQHNDKRHEKDGDAYSSLNVTRHVNPIYHANSRSSTSLHVMRRHCGLCGWYLADS